MLSTIRHIALESKVSHHVSLPLIEAFIPQETVHQVLTDCQAWEQREKKLNMAAMIYLIIGLSLFAHLSTREVWRRLTEGYETIWPEPMEEPPTAGALCQRRLQLGVTAMRELVARCVHPLATPATPGSFRFNLRVVALDGTLDNVADTPANRAVFPYNGGDGAGRSPFPQVRCVHLMECGTHVIFDSEITTTSEGEQAAARRVLDRSLAADMLLLWDRGFYVHELLDLVRRLGAHVLGRLASDRLPRRQATLSDGTYLSTISIPGPHGHAHQLSVRVIEYTIADEQVPAAGKVVRLVTTLLDPEQYPALELISLYHERWEIESGIDEHKTHLRLSARTLRSHTPQGVEQELYGMLLAHFVIRALMLMGAICADIDPDRLSYTHTLGVLQRSQWRFALTPSSQHATVRQRAVAEVLQERVPPRRLRFQARVVKRTHSRYRRKTTAHLRAPCLHQPFHTIVLLI